MFVGGELFEQFVLDGEDEAGAARIRRNLLRRQLLKILRLDAGNVILVLLVRNRCIIDASDVFAVLAARQRRKQSREAKRRQAAPAKVSGNIHSGFFSFNKNRRHSERQDNAGTAFKPACIAIKVKNIPGENCVVLLVYTIPVFICVLLQRVGSEAQAMSQFHPPKCLFRAQCHLPIVPHPTAQRRKRVFAPRNWAALATFAQ